MLFLTSRRDATSLWSQGHRSASVILGLCALLCLTEVADAQERVEQLRRRYFTSGLSVRRAFQDTIASARKSIVEIRHEGRPVSLGVIIDKNGWVVTKASDLPDTFVCRLSDLEKDTPAHLAATNDENDLALLKLEATELTPIEWESSVDPRVGQWVITPGTRTFPVAVGVVSVDRREIPRRKISGVMGIELELDEGPATIRRVFPDSGAENAGIEPGDIVETLNGKKVRDRIQLVQTVRKYKPGETLKLVVLRDEEEQTIEVTLTHPFGDFLSRIAMQNHMGGELSERRTGFDSVIQHDSVLDPRDCGGPALTLSGKAFGINIARAGRTETYVLPADVIVPLAEQMIKSATVTSVTE